MTKKKKTDIIEDQPLPSPKTQRLLRLEQVLELTTISRATWYRGVKKGLYPKPVAISARRRAWRDDDVAPLAA